MRQKGLDVYVLPPEIECHNKPKPVSGNVENQDAAGAIRGWEIGAHVFERSPMRFPNHGYQAMSAEIVAESALASPARCIRPSLLTTFTILGYQNENYRRFATGCGSCGCEI